MGILEPHLKLLAMEHEKHPIKGQVLTLGQQAVYATFDRVKQIYIYLRMFHCQIYQKDSI